MRLANSVWGLEGGALLRLTLQLVDHRLYGICFCYFWFALIVKVLLGDEGFVVVDFD